MIMNAVVMTIFQVAALANIAALGLLVYGLIKGEV